MPILKVFLDIHSLAVSGCYPLAIGLMRGDEKETIRTLYAIPEENFDLFSERVILSEESPLSAEKILEINNYLQHELDELESIIAVAEAENKLYPVIEIVTRYRESPCNGEFNDYVFRLLRRYNKRGGKVSLYLNLIRQITAYHGKREPLLLSEITPAWVNGFFDYISSLGLSQSACGSYERAFKGICKSASESGLLENYGRPRRCCTIDKNGKLDASVIKKLSGALLENASSLSLARDIFLFSYYAGGMPFSAIALLKKSDLTGNMIWYNRFKASKRKTSVKITPSLRELMARYENEGEYVFPLIEESGLPVKEQCRIHLLRYNSALKRLGLLLHLPVHLNSKTTLNVASKVKSDDSILLSVQLKGNSTAVRIPCSPDSNIEMLVMNHLRRLMRK